MYFRYLTFSCPGQTKFIHSTEKNNKIKIGREEKVEGGGGGGDKGHVRRMQGTLSGVEGGFGNTLYVGRILEG